MKLSHNDDLSEEEEEHQYDSKTSTEYVIHNHVVQ